MGTVSVYRPDGSRVHLADDAAPPDDELVRLVHGEIAISLRDTRAGRSVVVAVNRRAQEERHEPNGEIDGVLRTRASDPPTLYGVVVVMEGFGLKDGGET